MIDYDNTATYQKGDYCMYQGALYVANQDINTAEEFDSSHWDETSVINELEKSSKIESITLDNGTNTASIVVNQYYKRNGIVHINGIATFTNALSVGGFSNIATLPEGSRPLSEVWYPCITAKSDYSTINAAMLRIETSGLITVYTRQTTANKCCFTADFKV